MRKDIIKNIKIPVTFLTLLEKYNGKIMLATSEELSRVKNNGLDILFRSMNAYNAVYKN